MKIELLARKAFIGLVAHVPNVSARVYPIPSHIWVDIVNRLLDFQEVIGTGVLSNWPIAGRGVMPTHPSSYLVYDRFQVRALMLHSCTCTCAGPP